MWKLLHAPSSFKILLQLCLYLDLYLHSVVVWWHQGRLIKVISFYVEGEVQVCQKNKFYNAIHIKMLRIILWLYSSAISTGSEWDGKTMFCKVQLDVYKQKMVISGADYHEGLSHP